MRDKPECCDCCVFDTPDLKLYNEDSFGITPGWFCALCAGSMASSTRGRPGSHSSDVMLVVGVVMNAANHILKALKEKV